jgi:hypothetical protein
MTKDLKFVRTNDGKLDYAVNEEENSLIIAVVRKPVPGEDEITFICQTLTIDCRDGYKVSAVRKDEAVIGLNLFYEPGTCIREVITTLPKDMADRLVHTLWEGIAPHEIWQKCPTARRLSELN